jgi:putative peptidoglycan lipid II flippase
MRIGALSMGVNIVLSLLLVMPLKHVGLALAISLAAFVNAGALFFMLRRLDVYRPAPGWAPFLARVVLASGVMGLVLVWGVGDVDSWLRAPALERATRLSIWVITGAMVYLLTVTAFGVRLAQLLLRKGEGAKVDE